MGVFSLTLGVERNGAERRRERFWKTVGCPGRRGAGGPRSPRKTDWVMVRGGYLIGEFRCERVRKS